jgi:hypothetical protein
VILNENELKKNEFLGKKIIIHHPNFSTTIMVAEFWVSKQMLSALFFFFIKKIGVIYPFSW